MGKYIIQVQIGNAWYDDEQERKYDLLRDAHARLRTIGGGVGRFRLISRTDEVFDI